MGLAILDGDVLEAAEARIPVTDEGFLRGDGAFEVIRLYDGVPFAFDDHIERMAGSAGNLRLPFDADALRADVETLLAAAQPGDGALRLVVTRGGHRLGIVEPLPDYPQTIALATVEYSPTRILDGVKSLSYAANMLSTRLAQEQGADQALLVTPHGRVLEAPTCSFFCSFDGETLVTPPLSDHILDSITRRRLVPLTRRDERPIARDDLRAVREAFLASTLREVHPVHAIDGRALPQTPGPRDRAAAAEAMREHVAAELGARA